MIHNIIYLILYISIEVNFLANTVLMTFLNLDNEMFYLYFGLKNIPYASSCVTKTVGVSVNVTLIDMKEVPLSCCVIMNIAI